MNKSNLIQRYYCPQILQYSDIKSYLITVLFVALCVISPWLLHQINLAGPTFLPMHYFVLLAGLLYGWRAGLITGIISPLLSFSLSGMPVISMLLQTTLEIATYGFVSGILAQYTKSRSFWVLIGAMAAGRFVLLLTLSILGIFVPIRSTGAEYNSFQVVLRVIQQGWYGIIIQLISIPVIISIIEKDPNANWTKNIRD